MQAKNGIRNLDHLWRKCAKGGQIGEEGLRSLIELTFPESPRMDTEDFAMVFRALDTGKKGGVRAE